jgi:hypothetical protein
MPEAAADIQRSKTLLIDTWNRAEKAFFDGDGEWQIHAASMRMIQIGELYRDIEIALTVARSPQTSVQTVLDILTNKDKTPKVAKKWVVLDSYFANKLANDKFLLQIPERIWVEKLLAEKDKSYHVWGKFFETDSFTDFTTILQTINATNRFFMNTSIRINRCVPVMQKKKNLAMVIQVCNMLSHLALKLYIRVSYEKNH